MDDLTIGFKLIKGAIEPGDLYVNVNGGAPKVLVCSKIENGAVHPTTGDYVFDLCDVSKIKLVK